MGIEPTTSAWKAEVLPLNYTRIIFDETPITIFHAPSSASRFKEAGCVGATRSVFGEVKARG